MDGKIIKMGNKLAHTVNTELLRKKVFGAKGRYMLPEHIVCDGLFNIPIFNGMNEIIGRALLTRHMRFNAKGNGHGTEEAIVLMYIVIYKESDRRNGAADDVMKFLIEGSGINCIMTGESTPAGKALCMKHGFRPEAYENKQFLVWRKNDEHGEQGTFN